MKKLIVTFSFFCSVSVFSQCDTVKPDTKFIEAHGDPSSMGLGNIVHRGLNNEIKKRGCPIKKPNPIVNYVAITKEMAKRQSYDFNNENCNSVIIVRKGYEYQFKDGRKYFIYTGDGNAKGIVLETSKKEVSQLVGTYIKGQKITDKFGSW